MPLGEISSAVGAGVWRVVHSFVQQILIELLVRGSGYLICRLGTKKADPDGASALVVGLLFWCCIIAAVWKWVVHA